MFTPWVGANYTETGYFGGKRVLLVGESHYSYDPEIIGKTPPGFTSDVVRRYPLSGEYHRFFCNAMRAVMGLDPSVPWVREAEFFWNLIAFYNYVPVVVDGRRRSEGGNDRRPTKEMFRAGAEPFREVLARLEPDAVIVCGLALWGWLAPNLDGFNLDGFDGPTRDVIFYDDGRSVFTRIYHPSYPSFDWFRWHKRVWKLIEMTAEPRRRGRKDTWPMIQASEHSGVEVEPA